MSVTGTGPLFPDGRYARTESITTDVLVQVLIQLQTCHISASVVVVGCRPYSDQGFAEHGLVSLHNQLMGSSNQVQLVRRVKLCNRDTITEKHKIPVQALKHQPKTASTLSSATENLELLPFTTAAVTTNPQRHFPNPQQPPNKTMHLQVHSTRGHRKVQKAKQ